ncbi:MAG: hypothetical protein JWL77_4667 [Chthonomonadaceae bacterium]|nr:hypothetical protein [Chthonomonadaceae bacterium]
MRLPDLHRRHLRTLLGWGAAVGFVVGTAVVYRWAEPSPPSTPPVQNASAGSNVTMRLENAPFIGHSNGFKTWSLRAGRIELERMPGSSLSSIENVSLQDIKDGQLFPAPPTPAVPPTTLPVAHSPSGQTALDQLPPETEAAYGPWTAKFHAGRGHYRSGLMALPPPELALLYRLQSEFDLSQGVDFRTREGDHFEAESLTVLDLIHKQNGRSERRILCDNGMKITRKEAQMTANQARYDVSGRSVECLGGARATFPDGALQAERMYWSLDTGVLRCPETTTGTWQGMPFVAQGLTVDMKKRTVHANQIEFELRSESQEKPRF